MQIDGHHTMTYIAARLAGLSAKQANIVAYSAQYVDDATNSGVIHFKNGAMYNRISSAHKMLDYRNSDELANHQVWVPFHFLPGNGEKPAGENPDGSFIHKLICKPNSEVAKDMIKACLADRDKPYGLYRLGITMHVYADTWAHQGFAGVNHEVNEVKNLTSNDPSLDRSFASKIVNFFLSEAFPLGHGAALSHPDRPYLVWSYEVKTPNGVEVVNRNNPEDFLEAVDYMCRVMRCYKNGVSGQDLENTAGLPAHDKKKVKELINRITDDDGEDRHKKWLDAIARGDFSFGPASLEYKPKGVGSWKYKAIGQKKAADSRNDTFPYKKGFLRSDWKLFHDALQAHRFDILHDVLPRYGICAA